MEKISRTENSIRNIIAALTTQSLTILIGMVSRVVFIHTLGETYLGISGLFSSVIAVLSLTNLGLGDATLYLLIKHFSKEDWPKIRSSFEFAKKIYLFFVCIVIGAAVIMTPFIPMIVNLDRPLPHLYLYYYLFVANTAFSYFAAPYNTLFQADQKVRTVTRGQFISIICISITQIISLFLGANYTIYLVLMILTNIIDFVYIRYKFRGTYPCLMEKNGNHSLAKEDRKEAIRITKDMFMIKISYVLMDSIDNISISRIVGTITVGLYSNYLVITGAVRNLIKMFYQSVYSSFGELNMNSTPKTKEYFFKIETFGLYLLGSFSVTCILVLIQDFMTIWLGANYLIDRTVVTLACIDLYLNALMYAQENFVQTSEVFKKTKYLTLLMAVLNLIFTIVLGIQLGLAGILLATIIVLYMALSIK